MGVTTFLQVGKEVNLVSLHDSWDIPTSLQDNRGTLTNLLSMDTFLLLLLFSIRNATNKTYWVMIRFVQRMSLNQLGILWDNFIHTKDRGKISPLPTPLVFNSLLTFQCIDIIKSSRPKIGSDRVRSQV